MAKPRKQLNCRQSLEGRREVRLVSSRYQPSKAELAADMRIGASPHELMRSVTRDVKIGL